MAQPMPPSYMAYDRTIVVFSPDGRLLQVEYAREMVKSGSTSIGIKIDGGVLLGSVKMTVPLAVPESYRKTYQVDDHIGIVSAGSLADARELVDTGRTRAQIHQITYGEPISVASLTTYLCDRKHLVTQYAGVRPYGVGLLVGGVDHTGPKLFETEPSGTMIEWKAQAIGRGADKAKKILEKDYKEGLDVERGLRILVHALRAGEKDASPELIEVLHVTEKTATVLPASQVRKSF
ncbi:MAG: archaeal proteasome endopeptidase complex subunit alpha [Candidatus Aenigmarchaeota archaeon]|nr:archaeal proteasome endopeptidase complex subunit alpha [Candidatus Aenigmarchaeota archaeon]